jgi:cytosine/adenosine deaminase-related metal-dependent hydrolase
MRTSLIRARYVIRRAVGRTQVAMVEDGAVFQRDCTIVEVGRYDELVTRCQPDEVLGSPDHLVLPGWLDVRGRAAFAAC